MFDRPLPPQFAPQRLLRLLASPPVLWRNAGNFPHPDLPAPFALIEPDVFSATVSNRAHQSDGEGQSVDPAVLLDALAAILDPKPAESEAGLRIKDGG